MKKIIFLSALAIVINLFLTAPKAGAVATACVFTKSLYLGVSDIQVKCLQQYLNAAGYPVSVSGAGSSGKESAYFGAKTKAAVAKWQTANGVLPTSGYFGAISRAKYAATDKATPAPTTPIIPTIPTTTVATTTPLSITTTYIPPATAGTAYSVTLSASGGNGSYSWWVSDGSLPAGLNLVPGTIFGTPVSAWTYNFTITVTSGTQVATQQFALVINPSVANLKLSQTDTINLNNGQTFEIKAFYTPAPSCTSYGPCYAPDATQVKVDWTSSDSNIAAVVYQFYDQTTGVITGKSPGSATITANYAVGNASFSASVPVFVAGTIGARLQISPAAPSVGAGKTVSLQASYYLPTVCSSGSCTSGGSSTVQVTWASSNNAVATVAYKLDDYKTAIVTGISPGVTTITAVMGYNPTVGSGLTATTGLVVTPATQ
jgi:uncharacterized protein YjdB